MSRSGRVTLVFAAVGGVLAGVVITLAATTPRDEAAGSATTLPEPANGASPSTELPIPTTDDPEPALDPSTTLLVWTSGGLPDGLTTAVERIDGVGDTTAVAGGQTDLLASTDADGAAVDRVEDGWAIPLDTIAVDPRTFGRFVRPAARSGVETLSPGQGLLTESSAVLRGLTVGAELELREGTVEIVGVVDDVSGAGAELILPASDAARFGVETPRYLLLTHEAGARPAVTEDIAGRADGRAIRFRSPVETTWMRHGDAVAPTVFVKLAYGEFAYRDRPGRDVQIDPAWADEHLVDADVPILGPVRCHRDAIEPLADALRSLADENLGHLVDAGNFAGCWSPRRIDLDQPLSRHAWGIAVDLNISGNPRGSFSSQDPRLVDVMRGAGFTWGGLWLVPDPGHYELVPDLGSGGSGSSRNGGS